MGCTKALATLIVRISGVAGPSPCPGSGQARTGLLDRWIDGLLVMGSSGGVVEKWTEAVDYWMSGWTDRSRPTLRPGTRGRTLQFRARFLIGKSAASPGQRVPRRHASDQGWALFNLRTSSPPTGRPSHLWTRGCENLVLTAIQPFFPGEFVSLLEPSSRTGVIGRHRPAPIIACHTC